MQHLLLCHQAAAAPDCALIHNSDSQNSRHCGLPTPLRLGHSRGLLDLQTDSPGGRRGLEGGVRTSQANSARQGHCNRLRTRGHDFRWLATSHVAL